MQNFKVFRIRIFNLRIGILVTISQDFIIVLDLFRFYFYLFLLIIIYYINTFVNLSLSSNLAQRVMIF